MKNILKKEQGITLVALVTTIIILLILSGITIGTLTSKKGLINEANQSSEAAQKETIIEKIEADLYSKKTITGKMPNEGELIEIAEKYGTVDRKGKNINLLDTGYIIDFFEIKGWDEIVNDNNEFIAEKLEFSGNNYIDTGLKLFNDKNIYKDFEISFEITRWDKTNLDTVLYICDPSYSSSVFFPGLYIQNREGKVYAYLYNRIETKYHDIILTNNINNTGVKIKIRKTLNWLYITIDNNEETFILDYTPLYTTSQTFDTPLILGASLDQNGMPKNFCNCELQNVKIKLMDNQVKTANSFEYDGELEFNGTNYIDTGLKLFSDENINRNFEVSFELLRVDDDNINQATVINSKDEKESPWPGFLMRYITSSNTFEINASNTAKKTTQIDRQMPKKIQFKRNNNLFYYSIDNSNYTQFIDFSTIAWRFDVPVTFGASLRSSKLPQRYFKGKLRNISVKFTN